MTKAKWFEEGIQKERNVIVCELLQEAARLKACGSVDLSKVLATIAMQIREGLSVQLHESEIKRETK